MFRRFSPVKSHRLKTSRASTSSHTDDRHLELLPERLECRQMLAGDVSVVGRGGDLIVTGDNSDNVISIAAEAGGYLRVSGSENTRINGVNNGSVTVRVTDDLKINLKNGNNRLLIGELFPAVGPRVPDDVSIRTGNGNDIIHGALAAGDDISISTGSGEMDQVAVVGLDTNTPDVGDDLRVTAKGGLNFVTTAHIGDDARVSAGSGSSDILFNGAVVSDDLSVSTGNGDDDVVVLDTVIGDNLSINTKSGDDQFQFGGPQSYISGDIRLSMGSGFDTAGIFARLSSDTDIKLSGVEEGYGSADLRPTL